MAKINPSPQSWSPQRKARIARQHEQGVSISALAAQHSVSKTTIAKILDELGVTVTVRQTIRRGPAFPTATAKGGGL